MPARFSTRRSLAVGPPPLKPDMYQQQQNRGSYIRFKGALYRRIG